MHSSFFSVFIVLIQSWLCSLQDFSPLYGFSVGLGYIYGNEAFRSGETELVLSTVYMGTKDLSVSW